LSVPSVKNPIVFSETPTETKAAPPRLGEHTIKVLRDTLGFSEAEIAALKEAGVTN
jgi:crotonobetainyl-CoA:carnitine CoA-transferase CaiB-like acyl-CoA transferase